MKKIVFALFAVLFVSSTWAQNTVTGTIESKTGTKLAYATVTLLFPEDSTLAYFDITDMDGRFEIKDVKDGNYVLQTAFLGYKTKMQSLEVKQKKLEVGLVQLETDAVGLEAVEIEGAAVPFLIKKDTLEYNAAAFRVRANSTAEDLLKKMPGIEIDADGNIKAQGEDVGKVLVDGKEFFGSNPQMATKNLPADAVKKVQVFDKKSETAEFTGIDDGEREKTINLELKDDRKNGIFGEATAGYGTQDRFELNGKLSKFTEKTQSMALGNFNNLNDFGLDIMDYLKFSGNNFGGGRFRINSSNALPVSAGQSQNGILTSALGGATFAYTPRKNNDFSINYLHTYADRDLKQESDYLQYTPNAEINTIDESESVENSKNHNINLFWRNEIDSLTKLNISATATFSDNQNESSSFTQNLNNEGLLINESDLANSNQSQSTDLSADAKLIRKLGKVGRNISLEVSANHNNSDSPESSSNNFTSLTDTLITKQNLDDYTDNTGASVTLEYNEPLGKNYFLEFGIEAATNQQNYDREQMVNSSGTNNFTQDVLSELDRTYNSLRPKLRFKKNSEKASLSVGFDFLINDFEVSNNLSGNQPQTVIQPNTFTENRILPSFSYRKRFGQRNWFSLRYSKSLNFPNNSDLNTLNNLQNTLNIRLGNLNLDPEDQHSIRGGFMYYDQFTFTSFSLFAQATLTENNISNSINIDDEFRQVYQPINYKDAQSYYLNMNFNKPIKKLGIVVNLSGTETISNSYTQVNNTENQLTSFTHGGRFSVGNKKKKKVDIQAGVGFSLTDSKYSLQSNLNNKYTTTTYFADAQWFATDKLTFAANLDYNIYDSQAFAQSQSIPLLNAEVSYSFLKANSGILTLKCFDVLNQYSGIERFSYQNTIGENRSNVLTQYFLLSFTYKINQLAGGVNGGGKRMMITH